MTSQPFRPEDTIARATAAELDISDARILIVDDDPGMRMMCRTALETEGYELHEAADGEQAVQYFRRLQPDLVLMDAVMPRLPGITAVKRIRELENGADVPILIITGFDDEALVNRAFDVGATDFISKPVNWAVLRQRVRRTISGRRAERRVVHLAYHDSLTGLPNRRLFLDRLGYAVARAERTEASLAILFIDLDDFKQVNDRLGHECGDLLLKTVAERLSSAVRSSDTVARFGGDEFNIFLENVDSPDDVATVAESINRLLQKPALIRGEKIVTSASVGIAMFPDDAKDTGSLLKCADRAMYRAKEAGGGRCEFFEPEMGTSAMKRLLMEAELRTCIENEEFELFYQPRLDLHTGDIVAFEALLRWRHAKLGLVEAEEFIELADRAGWSSDIVCWVCGEAVRCRASWQAVAPAAPRMSVNVSLSQLRTPGLVEHLSRLLDDHGVPADAFDFEISERFTDYLTGSVKGVIRQLADLGIRIVFDDFGTGSMSVVTLTELPVSGLKIDRSVVTGVADDASKQVVCRGLAALAREFDMRIIAEGVESGEDFACVQDFGYHEAQGFHIGRPRAGQRVKAEVEAACTGDAGR